MGTKKAAAATGDVFPIGMTDFEKLISKGKVYIDKTSYLEELLNSGTAVALILRPRRFGKTLTMSMLSCFLEMNYQNPEDRSRPERLFKDLAIYKNKAFCDEYMGRYPVISISFKDAEGKTFQDAVEMIVSIFAEQAAKFEFLTKKKELDTVFLRRIKDCKHGKTRVFKRDGTFAEGMASLINLFIKDLANCLKKAFNKDPVIIIDEYDVPLQKATARGYYTDMLDVIRLILSSALKDNDTNIFKGFVTGCLRIAHQSIFTGVNNFDTYGINDTIYSGFIGLTKDETAGLLKRYGMETRLPDVTEWYDGYNFAGTGMLCPWSVIKFMSRALRPDNNPATFQPENYWANSSGNNIIDICMRYPDSSDLERIENLMHNGTETITLKTFTSYPEINCNTSFDTFATLMLHTGYFTVVKGTVADESEMSLNSSSACDDNEIIRKAVIKIPNKEVLQSFLEKAESIFSKDNPEWTQRAAELLEALFSGDAKKVQDIIDDMLMRFISNRDAMSGEGYYHGFMTSVLGIAAGTAGTARNRINRVEMESEKDAGNGFSDIILSKVFEGKAVILEFKKCEIGTPNAFKKMCREALKQIDDKKYEYRYRTSGYQDIKKYGIAFYGKQCLTLMPDNNAG